MTDEQEAPAAPQAPGDEGYEPPAITSELRAEGAIYKLGEEEFATQAEAEEARQALADEHTAAVAEAAAAEAETTAEE